MGNLTTQELNAWGPEFFERLWVKVKQVVECKFDFMWINSIFSEILFWNFYILCKRNCHRIFYWAFTTNQSNIVKQSINKRQMTIDLKSLSQYFWGRQPVLQIFSESISKNTGRYFWFSQSVFPRNPSWLKRVKRSWSLSRRRPSSASLKEKIFIFFTIQTYFWFEKTHLSVGQQLNRCFIVAGTYDRFKLV